LNSLDTVSPLEIGLQSCTTLNRYQGLARAFWIQLAVCRKIFLSACWRTVQFAGLTATQP